MVSDWHFQKNIYEIFLKLADLHNKRNSDLNSSSYLEASQQVANCTLQVPTEDEVKKEIECKSRTAILGFFVDAWHKLFSIKFPTMKARVNPESVQLEPEAKRIRLNPYEPLAFDVHSLINQHECEGCQISLAFVHSMVRTALSESKSEDGRTNRRSRLGSCWSHRTDR